MLRFSSPFIALAGSRATGYLGSNVNADLLELSLVSRTPLLRIVSPQKPQTDHHHISRFFLIIASFALSFITLLAYELIKLLQLHAIVPLYTIAFAKLRKAFRTEVTSLSSELTASRLSLRRRDITRSRRSALLRHEGRICKILFAKKVYPIIITRTNISNQAFQFSRLRDKSATSSCTTRPSLMRTSTSQR